MNQELLNLFIRSVFIQNLALSYFLGMCTFLAVSKKIETAMGLGLAVVIVQTITVPINNLFLTYILKKGSLAWFGFPNADLSFLSLICFIHIFFNQLNIFHGKKFKVN